MWHEDNLHLSIHEGHDHDVPDWRGTEHSSDDDVFPLPTSDVSEKGQHLVLSAHC